MRASYRTIFEEITKSKNDLKMQLSLANAVLNKPKLDITT